MTAATLVPDYAFTPSRVAATIPSTMPAYCQGVGPSRRTRAPIRPPRAGLVVTSGTMTLAGPRDSESKRKPRRHDARRGRTESGPEKRCPVLRPFFAPQGQPHPRPARRRSQRGKRASKPFGSESVGSIHANGEGANHQVRKSGNASPKAGIHRGASRSVAVSADVSRTGARALTGARDQVMLLPASGFRATEGGYPGQTRNKRHAFRGRTPLAAARKALSEVRKTGLLTCRRRTPNW